MGVRRHLTIIRKQPPRGGCVNCGAGVRTIKAGGWLCTACQDAEDERFVRRLRHYVAQDDRDLYDSRASDPRIPWTESELRLLDGNR